MYRLQDNVPEYLINESRDFQIFCRLYDCLNNGVKFSIDSIVRVMNTTMCGSSFLKLLESRVGFFTDGQYTDTEIRDILTGFCDMVKYKGSFLGIVRAVRTFLVAKNVKVPTTIDYDNDAKKISIGLRSRKLDTSLLDDILRYVMPAGAFVDYFYYAMDTRETPLEFGQRVICVLTRDVKTSRVVEKYNTYTDDTSTSYHQWKDFDGATATLNDDEKNAINNMLSNVGFTNIYSKSDDTTSEETWKVKTVQKD